MINISSLLDNYNSACNTRYRSITTLLETEYRHSCTSVNEIAERLQVNLVHLYKLIDSHTTSRRSRSERADAYWEWLKCKHNGNGSLKDWLRSLYEQHKTFESVGRIIYVSGGAVRRKFKKLGLSPLPKGCRAYTNWKYKQINALLRDGASDTVIMNQVRCSKTYICHLRRKLNV
jgi:hypothetical protein